MSALEVVKDEFMENAYKLGVLRNELRKIETDMITT